MKARPVWYVIFMVIGCLRVRLNIYATHSLKEKRSVIKSLIHRLRANHNCAVAETGLQDVWQSAEISIVTVYAEKSHVESLLRRLLQEIDNNTDFEIAAEEIEFL